MPRLPIPWRSILVVAGLIVLILLVMNFNQRMAEYHRMSNQLATVRMEATAVIQTQAALLTRVAYASSTEAVEEWAYQDSRWVRSGETLILLVPSGEPTPTPIPTPAPLTAHPPAWRIWWELFFGDH